MCVSFAAREFGDFLKFLLRLKVNHLGTLLLTTGSDTTECHYQSCTGDFDLFMVFVASQVVVNAGGGNCNDSNIEAA